MQIPKIIHLSVGRKGWSTTGSFVGFVSNMERATSGLDVHFLEWREDRCLYGWTCRIYEYGGIYADLDYECIDALDSLLENEFCCLASDPEEHARIFDKAHIVTNAFIAIEAGLRYMGLELISGKWYHA